MPEKSESRQYSSSFQTGRLRFVGRHRAWSEQRLHDWQLMYTFSGQGRLYSRTHSFLSNQGDVYLIRPKTQRSYEPMGHPAMWGHIWVHFHPPISWTKLLEWPEKAPGIYHLHLSTPELQKKVLANLSEMHEVGSSLASYTEELAVNLLKTALIRCQSANPMGDSRNLDNRVRRAMDLLSENLSTPFSPKTMAKNCGLSERQLFRLFREATGQSPRDYHESLRLEYGQRLLVETHWSIGEIAEQIGFENPFYFTLRFKRKVGMAPRSFRILQTA